MAKRIEKLLRKLHISRRIFLVISVSIIVFTVAILITTNWIVRNSMENRYLESDKALQVEAAQNAELLMADVNLFSVRLMGNENLYRIFRRDGLDHEERLALYQDAILPLIQNTEIADAVIVDNEGQIYSAGHTKGLTPRPDGASFERIDSSDHFCICGMTKSDTGESYICLGRRYYFYTVSASIGYLFFYLPETTLSDAVSASSADGVSALVTEGGLVLSCSEADRVGTYLFDLSLPSGEGYRYHHIPYHGGDSIYTVRYASELKDSLSTGVYTIHIYASDTLFASVDRLIWLVVLLELGVMLLAIGVCYLASKRIVRPIHELQDNLADFGRDGSLEPAVVEGNDEFAELESTYNEMISRIADLTKKNVEEKLEQRKLQLDALQAQINPHFLYNTLDTIVWIAKIKKQQEIADLAMALAGFFRISLHKGDKLIRVREELDFVKDFVLIEQTRFPDKFELVIDVDEELLDYMIFKIMIQPFVENAIKHGIAPKAGSGRITIRGRREENDLVFQIIDDGIGTEAASTASRQGELVGLRGYGIHNVNERIRLAYGEPYGVQIESAPDRGTTVTVRVPIIPH